MRRLARHCPNHDQTAPKSALRRSGHPPGRCLLESSQHLGCEWTTNRARLQQLGWVVALGDRRRGEAVREERRERRDEVV